MKKADMSPVEWAKAELLKDATDKTTSVDVRKQVIKNIERMFEGGEWLYSCDPDDMIFSSSETHPDNKYRRFCLKPEPIKKTDSLVEKLCTEAQRFGGDLRRLLLEAADRIEKAEGSEVESSKLRGHGRIGGRKRADP